MQRNVGGQLGCISTLSKGLGRRVELERTPVPIRKDKAEVDVLSGLCRELLGRLGALTRRRTATASRSRGTWRLFPDFVPLRTTAAVPAARSAFFALVDASDVRTVNAQASRSTASHFKPTSSPRRAPLNAAMWKKASKSEPRAASKNMPASLSDSARVSASFTFGDLTRRKILLPMRSSSTAHSKARSCGFLQKYWNRDGDEDSLRVSDHRSFRCAARRVDARSPRHVLAGHRHPWLALVGGLAERWQPSRLRAAHFMTYRIKRVEYVDGTSWTPEGAQ